MVRVTVKSSPATNSAVPLTSITEKLLGEPVTVPVTEKEPAVIVAVAEPTDKYALAVVADDASVAELGLVLMVILVAVIERKEPNTKSKLAATMVVEPSVRLIVMVNPVAVATNDPTVTEALSTLTDKLDAESVVLVPSNVTEKLSNVTDGFVNLSTEPNVRLPV